MTDDVSHRLKIRPKPFGGEDGRSWLGRAILVYGVGARDFGQLLGLDIRGPRLGNSWIWRKFTDSELLRLARAASASLGVLAQEVLGLWSVVLNPEGSDVRWMPSSVWAAPLKYCPSCLAADRHPHYRTEWLRTVATVCRTHRTYLFDQCYVCGRQMRAAVPLPQWRHVAHCPYCDADLRRARPAPADERLLQLACCREMCLAGGRVSLGVLKNVTPEAFFGIIEALPKLGSPAAEHLNPSQWRAFCRSECRSRPLVEEAQRSRSIVDVLTKWPIDAMIETAGRIETLADVLLDMRGYYRPTLEQAVRTLLRRFSSDELRHLSESELRARVREIRERDWRRRQYVWLPYLRSYGQGGRWAAISWSSSRRWSPARFFEKECSSQIEWPRVARDPMVSELLRSVERARRQASQSALAAAAAAILHEDRPIKRIPSEPDLAATRAARVSAYRLAQQKLASLPAPAPATRADQRRLVHRLARELAAEAAGETARRQA